MAYCTTDDVLSRIEGAELSGSRGDSSDSFDLDTVIEQAIENASLEVDAYVGRIVAVADARAAGNEHLKLICADLAAESAIRDTGNFPTDSVQNRAESARLKLLKIADRQINVGLVRTTPLAKKFSKSRHVFTGEES